MTHWTRRPKPILLTAAWLDRQGACEAQAELAIAAFGRRVTLTRHVLHEMAALNLDLDWLTGRLLSPEQWAAYEAQRDALFAACEAQVTTLRDACEAQCDALWAAYVAQVATLYAACEAQRTPLWDACEAQRAPLYAACEAQRTPLWAAYEAQCTSLRDACEAQRDALFAAYVAQRAPLCTAYGHARADLLADLLRLP